MALFRLIAVPLLSNSPSAVRLTPQGWLRTASSGRALDNLMGITGVLQGVFGARIGQVLDAFTESARISTVEFSACPEVFAEGWHCHVSLSRTNYWLLFRHLQKKKGEIRLHRLPPASLLAVLRVACGNTAVTAVTSISPKEILSDSRFDPSPRLARSGLRLASAYAP